MPGRYQEYSEFKNSGVEWFGNIPSHWRVAGFKKHIASIVDYRGKTPAKTDNGILLVTARNIKKGKLDYSLSQEYIAPNDYSDVMSRGLPEIGHVLFTTEAPLGEVANIDKTDIALAQRIIKFNGLDSELNNYYFKYLIMSEEFQQSLYLFASGSTVKGIKAERFVYLRNLLPSYDEQQKIANFLNHETVKIDTLIAKQEKLIELLKEKRQAVISHAVTRGLNPHVPMKDSGVEWLGEVPEHWDKVVFRHFIKTRKGVAFSTSDFCDSGVRVVKASDIKQLSLRKSDIFLPESFVNKYPKAFLKQGDIILSTVGSAAEVKNSAVGQIAMVPQELDSTMLNQNTVVFDSSDNVIHKSFIFFLLQTTAYRDHLDLHAHGTANQASLNVADMLDFRCVIPSIKEQKNIVEYLYDFIERVVKLETKASDAIDLMKERKTAIISAAVTGKIDVRNWSQL